MCSRGSVIPLFVKQIKAKKPITITVPEMTRFLMPLRDSVGLVSFAFENAKQGDLFIRKAKSATMADLVGAVKNVLSVPDHPTEVIGWRHGEKLFETLASGMELSGAEDLSDYWRLQTDLRGLNYKPYFSEGDDQTVKHQDFDSHNSERMTVKEIEELLMSLPEFVSDAFGGE